MIEPIMHCDLYCLINKGSMSLLCASSTLRSIRPLVKLSLPALIQCFSQKLLNFCFTVSGMLNFMVRTF